jgi:NTP pyrophosphatase (non-canonical NTP hydrolase)
MIDLNKLQKDVYKNKINKGFNVTNIHMEFCYIHEELAEAMHAYNKKLPDLGEEIADVVIYILGLSEILGVDLEKELLNKIEKNKKREYKKINGVLIRTKDA